MADNNIQIQIDQINSKLDLILDEAVLQKQNRDMVVDLVDDLAIVGKDAFKGMVDSLDNAGIEVDGEEFNHMVLNFIRNISNINMIFRTLENLTDLIKDFSPIVKQIGTDATAKFNEFDSKGYFEVMNQLSLAMDTIMSRYSRKDLEKLSDNIVTLTDTLLTVTDPLIMNKLSVAAKTFKEMDEETVPEYSIWKLMREINKPEVKKSLGFVMTFLKKINSQGQDS
ncbi:MAG: DUF1641 domain-containing protein [Bacteroidales bacterium]|nr:DUF1641 domain-containing protein [Bacteroidales bacterium]